MRQVFWQTTLLRICSIMRTHIRAARKALSSCSILQESNLLTDLLEKREQIVRKTLISQQSAIDFLKYY